jgi:hypothetical protein
MNICGDVLEFFLEPVSLQVEYVDVVRLLIRVMDPGDREFS